MPRVPAVKGRVCPFSMSGQHVPSETRHGICSACDLPITHRPRGATAEERGIRIGNDLRSYWAGKGVKLS